jgi:hypothetical protein
MGSFSVTRLLVTSWNAMKDHRYNIYDSRIYSVYYLSCCVIYRTTNLACSGRNGHCYFWPVEGGLSCLFFPNANGEALLGMSALHTVHSVPANFFQEVCWNSLLNKAIHDKR